MWRKKNTSRELSKGFKLRCRTFCLFGCALCCILAYFSFIICLKNGPETKTISTTDNRNDATAATIAAVPRILPKFCDSQTKFIENCNPQPTNCTETINTNSPRGIGNALMVKYSNDAKPVFEKNCRPIIRDGTPFKLLNYVRVPEYAVSVQSKKCIIHALTQPLPNVQTKIDQILRPDQQHLPLVAVHVRTGWADELVRRRDVWDKFSTSVCSHNDVAQYVSDPLGHAIYDTNFPEFNLDGMLDQVSEKANAKYGRQQWRFFVASDAPAVKQYASDYLKGNYVGDEALMTHGLVSHNVGVRHGQIPNSAVDTEEINANVFVDLIILSESSMFGYISSKYPAVAALRSQCSQENVFSDRAGKPRHELCQISEIARIYRIDGGGSDEHERSHFENPSTYDSLLDKLQQHLPKNSRSCLDSNQPMLACICWVKRAHA